MRRISRRERLSFRSISPRVGADLPSRPARRLGARARDRSGSRAARVGRAPHPGWRSGASDPGLFGQARRHTQLRVHQYVSVQRLRQRQGEDPKGPEPRRLPKPVVECAAGGRQNRSRRGARAGGGRSLAVLESDAGGAVHKRRLSGGDAPDPTGKLFRGRQDQARGGDQEAASELERGLASPVAASATPRRANASCRLWRELGRGRPGLDSRVRLPRRPACVDARARRLGEARGGDALAKRRNITITVPKGVLA